MILQRSSGTVIQLLLWLLLAYMLSNMLVLRYEYTVNIKGETHIDIHTAGLLNYILTGLAVKAIFFYTNVLYLLPQFSREKGRKSYAFKILGLFFICIVAECVIFQTIARLTYSAPLETLSVFWVVDVALFVFLWGISMAWFFVKAWLLQERMTAQLKQKQAETELKFLKAQINPHFLFNTLNNLYSIAQEKKQNKLADGISSLSDMMRYLLYESPEQFVPLEKEVAHMRSYSELYQLKYEKGEVPVTFKIDNIENTVIAPMILLPFVENAFKFGSSVNEKSPIDITIDAKDGHIHFSCSNLIRRRVMSNEYSGVGLDNVKKRLELIYKNKYTLDIQQLDNNFLVRLTIPKHVALHSHRR